jgi:hypothetical protein
MSKTEQNRVLAWRLKLLQEASVMPRNVVARRLWRRLVEVRATVGTSLWSSFNKDPRADGAPTPRTFQTPAEIQSDEKYPAPSNSQNECCDQLNCPRSRPCERRHAERQTANTQGNSQLHAALDSLPDGLPDRRPGGLDCCPKGHCRPDQSVKEARHRLWEATGEVLPDSHRHAPRSYRSPIRGAIP